MQRWQLRSLRETVAQLAAGKTMLSFECRLSIRVFLKVQLYCRNVCFPVCVVGVTTRRPPVITHWLFFCSFCTIIRRGSREATASKALAIERIANTLAIISE